MAGTPIQITLYDAQNEGKTYSRSIIPWGILKKAIGLTKTIGSDPQDVSEADVDSIANLVVDVFGGQFSIEELNNGADVAEMMTVMQSIMSRASDLVQANPTMTPSAKKKRASS